MTSRIFVNVVVLMLFVLLCGGRSVEGAGHHANPRGMTREARWRADIDFLAARMQAIHRNLFHALPQADFDRAVRELKAEIPSLTDNEVIIGIMELIAMPGMERDGHMQLFLFRETGFRIYPLRLYVFSDGVFAIDAIAPYERAIGARLVRIGNTNIEDVTQLLDPLITRDNEMNLKSKITLHYLIPELLQTLGVIADPERGQYVFEDGNGEPFTLSLMPIDIESYSNLIGSATGLPQRPEPLYLSNFEDFWWLQLLEGNRTLFIKYNIVQAAKPSGETLNAFSNRIARIVATNSVDKVVLDVHHCIGGNNATYEPLLIVLSGGAVNLPGRLYTLIGRSTFSAGANFVAELERRTLTRFAGEPTGGSPNHYGDIAVFALPHSRLQVTVPPRYWEFSDADDERLAIAPHLPVELSSAQFFNAEDPVLEAVLRAP